jgi:fatty-acid peroxygenase
MRFLDTGAEWSDHFVPQGGGRPDTGHRCPGELIAVGLLALTASRLALLDATASADQDLGWSWRRLPTMPRSGVLMDVGPTDPAAPSGGAVGDDRTASAARRG